MCRTEAWFRPRYVKVAIQAVFKKLATSLNMTPCMFNDFLYATMWKLTNTPQQRREQVTAVCNIDMSLGMETAKISFMFTNRSIPNVQCLLFQSNEFDVNEAMLIVEVLIASKDVEELG